MFISQAGLKKPKLTGKPAKVPSLAKTPNFVVGLVAMESVCKQRTCI